MNLLVSPASSPLPGQRIRLRKPVKRFDLFVAPVGLTGFVTEVDRSSDKECIRGQMDQDLSEDFAVQAQIEREYQNCIEWRPVDLPGFSRSALQDFLEDCEFLPPYPLEDLVLRAPGQNLDGRLPGGCTCNVLKSVSRDLWVVAVYSLDKPFPDHRWHARYLAELIARGKKVYGIDLATFQPK